MSVDTLHLKKMASANGDGKLEWITLFDNMKEKEAKNKDDMGVEIPDIDDILGKPEKKKDDKSKSGGNSRLSVERIYQKKTQLEHILLRPDTYIGSVEKLTQNMWVYDDLEECFTQREITYVPGLYKIFDEILVNAADNKQRDNTMNCIKIDIDPENNKIKIWNNGKGIPVVEHKVEKVHVPSLIFGTLLTSSNYNDEERKVTGGRNGYGAKLCNIFSTKFIVETSSKESNKSFKQEWGNNMGKTSNAKIMAAKSEDFTCVSFWPDLSKFKMETLDRDIVDLFSRRAYDIAAATKGVKVFLNGKKLPIRNFKDFVDMHVKGRTDDANQPLKVVYENVNARWEVAVTLSEKGFQQVSFVNSIATTKGGRHVDYVTDQLVTKLIETVKKKQKKGDSVNIKPFQVKGHLWVFVNCLIENPAFDSQTKETLTTTAKHFGSKCSLPDKFIVQVKNHVWCFVNCQIENPTFDSQTKENMTLQQKSFGSKCPLPDKFIIQANKVGIVESIMSWMKYKAQEKMNKKCGSTKHSKLKGIPKLDDANDAGTRNSMECTLILTEGDSAKTLAVSGLSVVGRDRYGVFPLKGKVLNVREASQKQIMENAEINNIIKIIGLRYKEKYDTADSLKTLRYGKIMIMTDQDQDGSHIKGLLVNFIHYNWPGLLKQRFLEEFITPIVKVTKNKKELSFYSLPEFEEWKKETDGWHTWRVKYYKGLGTSTAKEAKEYFSEMERHRIPFRYTGTDDDAAINLAFNKKKVDDRKEWLTNWMEERKRRNQLDLPEIYLYGKETKSISFNEFINRELILFSNMDNERSIPSLVDGFKPGQRKVIFTCFKRNLIKEIKVAQLAGSVSELSSYHHGENSLMGTIICLAQNFVGSNNINLLQPIGQFGTRLHGGKDAASPRYIFTQLSPLARMLFNVHDDPLLKAQFDDNQKIEPEWYMPIIPTVLVNGAEGIGTGWSTKIPNYDPREIVLNIRKMLDGEDPQDMVPSFKNFKGTITPFEEQKYVTSGEVAVLDETTVEITELPIRSWTQNYKENVLEPMLLGTEKVPPTITDYKEYHTDTTVKFIVKMTPEKLAKAEAEGLHKVFKLQANVGISTMVLFDNNGCIKKYSSVTAIMKEFFDIRMDFYQRRKDYMEGMLAAESLKLDNQARFILEKIEGTIVIENKPKKELVQILVKRGYDSDPVKTWKEAQNKLAAMEVDGNDSDDESTVSERDSGPDFNYILGMPLWCLTKEKKDEILKNRDIKSEELYQLRKKTPSDLWKTDLNQFLAELDRVEEQERQEVAAGVTVPTKSSKGRKTFKKLAVEETKPSPVGRRVEPKIDPVLKSKAAAERQKKQRAQVKAESGTSITDFFNEDDGDMEPKSLMDRSYQDQQFICGGIQCRVVGQDFCTVNHRPSASLLPTFPHEGQGPGFGLDCRCGRIGGIKKGITEKPVKEKKPRAPRQKKDSFDSPKKKSPKKKPKNPEVWSDMDTSNDDLSVSELSQDNSFERLAIPRETGPRRAAASKAKYNFDDDEDEGEIVPGVVATDDHEMEVISDGDDYQPYSAGPLDSSGEKPAASKKPAPILSDISDLSDVESKPSPKKASPKKNIFNSVSDSDDDMPLVSKVTKSKVDSESDSNFDHVFPSKEVKPKKAAAKEPKPKKPKAAPKRKKKSSDVSDISDGEFKPKPKKKTAPKKAPAKKKALVSFSDSDDEIKPQKTVGKKKKTYGSEDESVDDDFNIGVVEARPRAGRAKPAVKYNFDDDDDDDWA